MFAVDPHCHSRGPSKVLPEFLVWPLVIFYCLGKSKSPVGKKTTPAFFGLQKEDMHIWRAASGTVILRIPGM